MELRRAAEVLLRCHTSALSPVLDSSLYIRTKTASITQRSNLRRPIERSFTSSSRCSLRFPTVTTSAAPEPDDKKNEAKEYFKNRFGALTQRKAVSRGLSEEARVNGGYSDTAMMTTLSRDPRSLGRTSKDYDFTNNMISPVNTYSDVPAKPQPISRELQIPPPMRLTPSTGRTVNITPKIEVGRAFDALSKLVARNRVKRDFNDQRFHERPGLKIKRLRRERWRKSFRTGFQAVVDRVKSLRNQGW